MFVYQNHMKSLSTYWDLDIFRAKRRMIQAVSQNFGNNCSLESKTKTLFRRFQTRRTCPICFLPQLLRCVAISQIVCFLYKYYTSQSVKRSYRTLIILTSSNSIHLSCTSSHTLNTASIVWSLFCHFMMSSANELAALPVSMLCRETWVQNETTVMNESKLCRGYKANNHTSG